MVFDRALYTECQTLEPPKVSDDSNSGDSKDDPFGAFSESAVRQEEMIDEVRKHNHCKVESGQLVWSEY